MTVRDIALTAAAILQADELTASLGETGQINDADAATLVGCVDLALAELASDGLGETTTERVEATGGIIPMSAFSSSVAAIKRVAHKGRARPFGVDSRGVSVGEDGLYDVTYAITAEYGPDDEVVLSLVTRADAAYLAARNYCLMTGRTDEAAIWDGRFAAEMEKKRMGRRMRLPRRAWR